MKLKYLSWIFVSFFLINLVNAIPPNGVSYLKFSDNALDEWGTNNGVNNGGTYVNDYPFYNITGSGQPKAISFLKTSNQNVNFAKIDLGTTFTTSIWVYFNETVNQYVIGSMGSGAEYILLVTHDLDTLISNEGPGSDTWEVSGANMVTDVWYNIVQVRVNNNMDFYINGTKIGDDTDAGGTSSSFDAISSGDGQYFTQLIDEFKIFNDELSTDNIKNLYNYNTINGLPNMEVGFYTKNPLNDTNINQSTDLNFTLYSVNGSADCNYIIDGTLIETISDLGNETRTVSFNSTNWQSGYNLINITCTDNSETVNNYKYLFVDNIAPEILYIKGNNQTLNNSIFSTNPNINFSIKTNDTNNYYLNFTVIKPDGSALFSNYTDNVSAIFELNYSYNFDGETPGTYIGVIKSGDAHTLKDINYNNVLKDKPYQNFNLKGKVFDGKVKSYGTNIKEFNLIKKSDRKKFDIKFNKNVKYFDMYVEGDKSVKYLSGKYGYQGHFIIDNYYWYDLENNDGATIKSVTKVSDKKYIISMQKPLNKDRIVFNSIGVININYINVTFQYLTTNVNISLYDSVTNNLLTENITVQYVGTSYQSEKTTTSGKTNFSVFVDESSDDVSFRAFETNNDDYTIVIKNEELTLGGNYNVDLYLTNTSDLDQTNLVTFHVQDENGYDLEGAEIIIQKQNPSNNQYITLTEISTSPDGEATTILQTDNIFYTFTVNYLGQTRFTSDAPITISLNDDDIYITIVLEDPFDTEYSDFAQIGYTLSYNKISNSSGNFNLFANSDDTFEYCLEVSFYNSTNNDYQFLELSCQNSTTANIDSSVINSLNRTLYYAKATAEKDGEETYLDSLYQYIGQIPEKINKLNGLFILFIIVLVAAFGFLLNMYMGLIFLSLGFIIISLTGLIPQIGLSQALTITVLSIVAIFVIQRLDK